MKPTIAFYRMPNSNLSAATVERIAGLISTEITIHETPHHEWLVMAAPSDEIMLEALMDLTTDGFEMEDFWTGNALI